MGRSCGQMPASRGQILWADPCIMWAHPMGRAYGQILQAELMGRLLDKSYGQNRASCDCQSITCSSWCRALGEGAVKSSTMSSTALHMDCTTAALSELTASCTKPPTSCMTLCVDLVTANGPALVTQVCCPAKTLHFEETTCAEWTACN